MSILAGVIRCAAHGRITDELCEALRKDISRNAGDERIEFRDEGAFFVKVDVGAYDRPAHRRAASGSFAMLAGEPLPLDEGVDDEPRDVQLRLLHDRWDEGRFDVLRRAAGTFCAAYYDPRRNIGYLVADRLGLRPLYYAIDRGLVYFASAMRILEALPELQKTMDVVSVVEMTGFGYPFGGGTPYAGVTMLEACEVVTVSRDGVRSSRYFAWDSIRPSSYTEQEALHWTLDKFRSAVRRRLRGDRTVAAYLSGGLDSRCVVAALRSEGVRLHTFNFSLAGTQDQAFGAQFAARIGSAHHDAPTGLDPDWAGIMRDSIAASDAVRDAPPEHPRLAWSGEGGSVGLGHVYITPEIVARIRVDDIPGAVDVFLAQQKKNIQTRILRPRLARSLRGYLGGRLCSELERIRYPDRLRALFIFLIVNGPRRHLEGHYDRIDLHRLEFQMPFNDADFLEHVVGLDIEPCLYHRFYVKWMSQLDPAVSQVPWQAYPGHVPSPAVDETVPDQWIVTLPDAEVAKARGDLLHRGREMLADRNFPHVVLRRNYLRLMHSMWQLDLANYGYAIKTALTYYHYWRMTDGRYRLSRSGLADGADLA
jgi:hypothetical protein